MSKKCKHTRIRDGYEILCGSYAFNLWQEDIDQGELCDRHYWQGRTEQAEAHLNNLLGSINECLEYHMKRDGLTQEIYSDLLSIWEKAKETER